MIVIQGPKARERIKRGLGDGVGQMIPRLLGSSWDSCLVARVARPSDSARVWYRNSTSFVPEQEKKKGKQTKLGTTCTRALEMEVGMRGCRFWWVPVFGRQYPYKDFAFSFQKFLFFELKIIVGTCLVLFLSYWQKEFFFKFSFFKSYFQFLWCLIGIAVEIFGI